MNVENLLSLLPELDFADFVRLEASARAVDDPARRWARSGSLLTYAGRTVPPDRAEVLFREAEREATEFLRELFRNYREAALLYLAHDVAGAIDRVHGMADLYERRGAAVGRLRALERALRLSIDHGDRRAQRQTLLRLGDASLEIGGFERAFGDYLRAFEAARQLGETADMARASLGLGSVRLEQGRLNEAEPHFRRGMALADGVGEERALARLYEGLGAVEGERGELDAAARWSDRALEIWSRVEDPSAVGECYDRRGSILMSAGRPELAEKFFRLALDSTSDARSEAGTHARLGESHLVQGRLLAAEEEGRSAEDVALAHRLPAQLVHAYRLLGRVAGGRGESGGVAFFETALRLCERGPYPQVGIQVLYEYGRFRESIDELDRAHDCYRRSLELSRSLGVTRWNEELERRIEAVARGMPIVDDATAARPFGA